MLVKFDGNKNKLHEFTHNCDKAMQLINPAYKTILLGIIETKLTDNARALTRNREYPDLSTLKDHLYQIYGKSLTTGQWQLELNSCKQNVNESVVTFSSRIETVRYARFLSIQRCT